MKFYETQIEIMNTFILLNGFEFFPVTKEKQSL